MTSKPCVLIVEDEEFNRDLLVQLLGESYEVVTAADGKIAVELAASRTPDVILMDLTLPVLDGWEATRRIKGSPSLTDIPIIAVTGHDAPDAERKARACGCDDFISKPIDEDLLLAKIHHHLGEKSKA